MFLNYVFERELRLRCEKGGNRTAAGYVRSRVNDVISLALFELCEKVDGGSAAPLSQSTAIYQATMSSEALFRTMQLGA